MKSILLLFILVLTTINLPGQDKSETEITSGRITYEEKFKLEIKLEGDAAQFASMLPKERTTQKILLFTRGATLFEEGNNVEEEMAQEEGEGIRIKMMGSAENKLYSDLKNRTILEQRDFMNRIFLIEKEMPEKNWKISGKQKIILGYPCMEAVSQDTAGVSTTVWFAPSLTIKGGPASFCNLPGMVLEVNVNDGSRTYIAKSIEQVSPGEMKLQRPKDGKKVSEKEFKEIQSEKLKEMGIEEGQNSGSGVQMRVIIKN